MYRLFAHAGRRDEGRYLLTVCLDCSLIYQHSSIVLYTAYYIIYRTRPIRCNVQYLVRMSAWCREVGMAHKSYSGRTYVVYTARHMLHWRHYMAPRARRMGRSMYRTRQPRCNMKYLVLISASCRTAEWCTYLSAGMQVQYLFLE